MTTAFIFPGQGSQKLGMLAELADHFSSVKETFAEASDKLGYDLWQLTQEGPAETLNQTDKTQPAILTASVAIWRVWQEQGGATPCVLAGHSLGEYSALTCAGVFEFADAVALVKSRGEYMQSAVPAGVGAMAAVIGLADELVVAACSEAAEDEVVAAVNFNSPGQVVIAGHAEAVKRASVVCKEKGARMVKPLPVSVPSHCDLMQPAAEKLAADLDSLNLSVPSIPVINNVDVTAASELANIKDSLKRQLFCPVRWTETVQSIAGQGCSEFFEMGPGNVLTGLNKRIDKSLKTAAVNDSASLAAALAQ